MWDPISIFYICYLLNYNLPGGRLDLTQHISDQEKYVINKTMAEIVKLREGL